LWVWSTILVREARKVRIDLIRAYAEYDGFLEHLPQPPSKRRGIIEKQIDRSIS